ncbi:MAG: carbohydrate porin [Pseudomonadota bacterium]
MKILIGILLFALASSTLALEESEQGLKSEIILTLESVSNLNGGIEQRSGFLQNLDITFEVDTKNASLWDNGTFFVYFLGSHGSNPTEYIGDIQASSNIEAFDTFKLYEAWYEHQWGDFSLLAGLHDYNSEFDVLESAGLFFGSSFGISPDTSQLGPSIFPTTALAIRGLWLNEAGYFVRGAIYDGIPGDPDNESGTHIILKKSDGLFNALELGQETNNYKIALGGWYHTTDYTDFADKDRNNNKGIYLIAEHHIGKDSALFVQLGSAQEDRNEIGRYVGLGWHTTNLFNINDEAGFAIAHARASKDNRKLNNLESAETAFELSYAYLLNKHVHIQPSLQYVMNPSMDSNIDNATVFAIRLTLSY